MYGYNPGYQDTCFCIFPLKITHFQQLWLEEAPVTSEKEIEGFNLPALLFSNSFIGQKAFYCFRKDGQRKNMATQYK